MDEPVVERAHEFNGWRIRSKDQMPGQGSIVTDHWLMSFGFSKPSRFNLDKIIAAMMANMKGYGVNVTDLEKEQKRYGSIFQEGGAARDIQLGEGTIL
jgi:hypothetical protein